MTKGLARRSGPIKIATADDHNILCHFRLEMRKLLSPTLVSLSHLLYTYSMRDKKSAFSHTLLSTPKLRKYYDLPFWGLYKKNSSNLQHLWSNYKVIEQAVSVGKLLTTASVLDDSAGRNKSDLHHLWSNHSAKTFGTHLDHSLYHRNEALGVPLGQLLLLDDNPWPIQELLLYKQVNRKSCAAAISRFCGPVTLKRRPDFSSPEATLGTYAGWGSWNWTRAAHAEDFTEFRDQLYGSTSEQSLRGSVLFNILRQRVFQLHGYRAGITWTCPRSQIRRQVLSRSF